MCVCVCTLRWKTATRDRSPSIARRREIGTDSGIAPSPPYLRTISFFLALPFLPPPPVPSFVCVVGVDFHARPRGVDDV